ncbi:MAG: hypothetical protein ABH846_03665 [Patescibacteria group bacterium]
MSKIDLKLVSNDEPPEQPDTARWVGPLTILLMFVLWFGLMILCGHCVGLDKMSSSDDWIFFTPPI